MSYGLDSLTMIEKVYIRQPVYKGEVQRDKFIVRRTQGEPMFVAAVDGEISHSIHQHSINLFSFRFKFIQY